MNEQEKYLVSIGYALSDGRWYIDANGIETDIWYAHYGPEDYLIAHLICWIYPPKPPEEE